VALWRFTLTAFVHGLPGGPGERERVFFEYPTNPNGNVIAFPRRRA
jgi:hypothetical protein